MLKAGRVYVAASVGVHLGYHGNLAPEELPTMLLNADVRYIQVNTTDDECAAEFSFGLAISGLVENEEKTYSYFMTCAPDGCSTAADVKGWFHDLLHVSIASRNWARTGKGVIAVPVAAAGIGTVGIGSGVGLAVVGATMSEVAAAAAVGGALGAVAAPLAVCAVVAGTTVYAGAAAVRWSSSYVTSEGSNALGDPYTIARAPARLVATTTEMPASGQHPPARVYRHVYRHVL